MPPPLPLPSIQTKRSARWVLLFLLIPVVAALVIIGRRARLHFRAEARVKAVRAASLPTSGAETSAWVPAVPNAQNGALVITQAFALMRNFNDGRSNAVVVSDLLSTNVWSAESTAVVRDYVEMNQPALAKIREGLKFEKFRYPENFKDGMAALLPHLAKHKQASSMMAAEVALVAADGRTNEWGKYLCDEIAFAETLNGEPLLISQLVRAATLTTARNAAEWALRRSAPPPEDCKQLQEIFSRAGETNLFPNTLISERAFALPLFRATIQDIDNIGGQGEVTEGKLLSNGMTFYRAIGAADLDRIFYLDFMEKAISITRLGPPESLELVSEFETAAETAKNQRYIISGMILPALARAAQKFAAGDASMRMAATAFAIERFRQIRGAWPDDLQGLVPEFLGSVPIDPFDGEKLRYIPSQNGYRIYSIGEDEIDDGGRALKGRKKSTDKTTYDMVFEVQR